VISGIIGGFDDWSEPDGERTVSSVMWLPYHFVLYFSRWADSLQSPQKKP